MMKQIKGDILYSRLPLIQHPQDVTDAWLSNIPDYQKVPLDVNSSW